MKLLFTVIFSLSLIGFGQTKLIAFKSHSGAMSNFSIDGIDNIGLPSLSIDTIKYLNDSTIIEIRSRGNGWDERTDTVVNHPVCKMPHLTVDTLKGVYYRNDIEFVGFDTVLTKREERRQKKWSKNQEKLKVKRAKLLKEYQEVDEKIMKKSNMFLLGNDSDDTNMNNTALVKNTSSNYLKYFSFGLIGVMGVFFMLLYFYNKTKITV